MDELVEIGAYVAFVGKVSRRGVEELHQIRKSHRWILGQLSAGVAEDDLLNRGEHGTGIIVEIVGRNWVRIPRLQNVWTRRLAPGQKEQRCLGDEKTQIE